MNRTEIKCLSLQRKASKTVQSNYSNRFLRGIVNKEIVEGDANTEGYSTIYKGPNCAFIRSTAAPIKPMEKPKHNKSASNFIFKIRINRKADITGW
jgi:hypothetical protein